ncbi:hypothetical protein [Rhizobacter sp. Root1221]|uniref:hypothetical protein n=1 Tax=Rhizobacter sp. Root1221 TaxID=1736433 RepID=UPI0006FE24F9|nr:hypothetical protein [Rhizobacter sp. Root1221]KQV94742.1 hypothetical protein ASC87_25875 [Rhizobacter sp. Root1221]
MTSTRLALISFSLALLAQSPLAMAHGWVSKTTVQRVTTHDWGDSVFIYTSTLASTEACEGKNPLVLLRSNPQFKEIYAQALLAVTTGATIGGFTYGCDAQHYNLPILQRLDLLATPDAPYP